MLTYLISSALEKDRIDNIDALKGQLHNLVPIEAIYPSRTHVPFLTKLLAQAKQRTNRSLSAAELGLLLSHRQAWHSLVNSNLDSALVLESDSMINNFDILARNIENVQNQFDLFFWGAYDGRMKIYTKDRTHLANGVYFGKPVINSVFCTYGYSLNKKAALFLLKETSKVNYPVDFWKIRLKSSHLRVGGISPEIISTNPKYTSTIQANTNTIFDYKFVQFVIDLKNNLLAFLNER